MRDSSIRLEKLISYAIEEVKTISYAIGVNIMLHTLWNKCVDFHMPHIRTKVPSYAPTLHLIPSYDFGMKGTTFVRF